MAATHPVWFDNLSTVNFALSKIYFNEKMEVFLTWKKFHGIQFAPYFDEFNARIEAALNLVPGQEIQNRIKILNFKKAIQRGAVDQGDNLGLLPYLQENPEINKIFEEEFSKPNSPIIVGLKAFQEGIRLRPDEEYREIYRNEAKAYQIMKEFKFLDLNGAASTLTQSVSVVQKQESHEMSVTSIAMDSPIPPSTALAISSSSTMSTSTATFFSSITSSTSSATAENWIKLVYAEIKRQLMHILRKKTPEEHILYGKVLIIFKGLWVNDNNDKIDYLKTQRQIILNLANPLSDLRKCLEVKATYLDNLLDNKTNAFQRIERALQIQLPDFTSFRKLLKQISQSPSLNN